MKDTETQEKTSIHIVFLYFQDKLDMANAGDYIVVAAIDFGTTYSGYGFSFSSAEKDIILNKNWRDMQGFQVSTDDHQS